MSNDAKLGLMLGVAIVLVIALVFFRSDTLDARAPADRAGPTATVKKDQTPSTSPQIQLAPVQP